ncbi:tyrosine-protein kinase [Plakobranchus ocellatus]|uniref:non-specific protein-tyrosine kinase n=1 Tax=Plakobranchus ocellatus TaxID=259542 RepID=A0AAV4CYV2_9GAST|nr:tyrosine-protein kinase [Plakobranchus ocellatus]
MWRAAGSFISKLAGWDESQAGQNSGAGDDPGLPNVYNAPFFYGRITREESEEILKMNGMQDGMYLLRESITPMGNFSLTIVHNHSCIHYSIEKKVNGQYMVSEGTPFPDPLSLIKHYQMLNNGFATMPKVPCNRHEGQEAIAFRGLSVEELHAHMKAAAKKMNANMSRALGPMRESLLMHVLQTLHERMPWFHGEISRDEGVRRLERSGHVDGKFIVRRRADGQSYALTLSHEKMMRHYLINQFDGDSFYIDAGPRFKALIVVYYQSVINNLLSKPAKTGSNGNAAFIPPRIPQSLPPAAPVESTRRRPPPPPVPSPNFEPSRGATASTLFWDTPHQNCEEDEEEIQIGFPEVEPLSIEEAERLENTYIDIREDVMTSDLRSDQVILEGKLGSGQFGEVRKGRCQVGGKTVPVAVKTLKNNDPDGEKEILSEASLMKSLDHQHIVRMIGVCKGETLMLVLELAELGPLKKYLERHQMMKLWHQVELMMQICDGMEYLEMRDVVHRDLATRNVLLVNDHFAKISDFGLSRILDNNSEYYTAHGPGRWPLMWYAPECLYYHKFDSSSDVWSFGITMWEIMSFGARPYSKKKPSQILHFLESGNRLDIPRNCPNRIYQIMLDCWAWNKGDRRSFRDLKPHLVEMYEHYKQRDI